MTTPVQIRRLGGATPTRTGGNGARPPVRPRWLLAALALVLAVIVARAVSCASTSLPAWDGSAREIVAGVPVGQPQTAAGARAAAADYAQTLAQDALRGDQPLAAAQQETFAASTLQTTAPRVRVQARTVRAALQLAAGGRQPVAALDRHVPIGARLLSFTRSRASVAVWSADVSAARGGPPAQVVWMTEQLVLVWQDGRWRITEVRAATGPVPVSVQSQPSTAATLYEQLRETRPLRHAG